MAEYQSLVPATLAPGSKIKTDTVNGELVEYVKIDMGGTGASIPLTSQNFGSWLSVANRSIVINYTDATKTVVSSFDFKENGATIYSIAYASGSTTDTYSRS